MVWLQVCHGTTSVLVRATQACSSTNLNTLRPNNLLCGNNRQTDVSVTVFQTKCVYSLVHSKSTGRLIGPINCYVICYIMQSRHEPPTLLPYTVKRPRQIEDPSFLSQRQLDDFPSFFRYDPITTHLTTNTKT